MDLIILCPDMIAFTTKRFEFDLAHRLPNHNGPCRNIHGHRYALEVTVRGEVNASSGASDEGMVIDFKELDELVKETVVRRWDHSLLLYKNDPLLEKALSNSDQHIVKTDYVPTAENMVVELFRILSEKLSARTSQKSIRISRVRLYETPTSWAEVDAQSN